MMIRIIKIEDTGVNVNSNDDEEIKKFGYYYINKNNRKFMKLDEIGILILKSLARDSRITLKELSKKTGLAMSTIHNRITRFVSERIIEKFTIIVNPEKLGYITIFILLKIDKDKMADVIDELISLKEVLEIYEVLNDYNLILKVRVKDVDYLMNFIEKLSKINGVVKIKSIITTRRYKEDTWEIDC